MALHYNLGGLPSKRHSGSPFSSIPFTPSSVNKPTSGTLIIYDTFVSRNGEVPHGRYVAGAAINDGFQGSIECSSMLRSSLSSQQVSREAWYDLVSAELDPQRARQALENLSVGLASSLLDDQAENLRSLTKRGYKNSVLNLSLGQSKAKIVEANLWSLRSLDRKDPTVVSLAQSMLANQARAFDLDAEKILSDDPLVHGPERQKLQQRVIDHTSDLLDNSTVVAQSRAQYDSAVSDFEKNNNSVVISAGNDARIAEQLEKANHGLPLSVPEDFTTSVLENEEVTSVGATAWQQDGENYREQKADYSVAGPGVDIYANGDVGFHRWSPIESVGTSFAAPKVAAAMANLHRLHPDMSSTQVESLLKESLTHGLNRPDDDKRVLDFQKNFQFLQTNTY